MNILIAGGTGLIGKALLSSQLFKSSNCTILTRSEVQNIKNGNIQYKTWNPEKDFIDISKEQKFNIIINLAGTNIASGRWTKNKKKELIDSRVNSTRCIVNFIKKLSSQPELFINASAIGYYKPLETGSITEQGQTGTEFISQICTVWENEAKKAESPELRTIQARIGIVLSKEGGALNKMLLPFSLGLGGKLGSGKQYMSWISLDDIVSSFIYMIENKKLNGPVNLCSPFPITNKDFTKTLGKALGRPTPFPVPAFLLKLLLGEMADQLLLSSLPVVPEKLLLSGFEFKDKELEGALKRILNS